MSSEKQTNEKILQYVAIATFLVGALAFAWRFYPRASSQTDAPAITAIVATATQTPLEIGNPTACGAFDSIAAAKQYDQEPPMKVDQAKQYFATFKMAQGGEFIVELYPAKAPITVNSFVFLACKKFFDGLTFHRVLKGFMAQGGDPTGSGDGGPGYEFVYEGSDLKFDKAGVVAMANIGPKTSTNGSQFFITFAPVSYLNDGYTIFGQVVKGMDVVKAITLRDPDTMPSFKGDAMETVTITAK